MVFALILRWVKLRLVGVQRTRSDESSCYLGRAAAEERRYVQAGGVEIYGRGTGGTDQFFYQFNIELTGRVV